jgi:hypothetical protein
MNKLVMILKRNALKSTFLAVSIRPSVPDKTALLPRIPIPTLRIRKIGNLIIASAHRDRCWLSYF